jgi:hypothetical protein
MELSFSLGDISFTGETVRNLKSVDFSPVAGNGKPVKIADFPSTAGCCPRGGFKIFALLSAIFPLHAAPSSLKWRRKDLRFFR